jgi:hypothetical protein
MSLPNLSNIDDNAGAIIQGIDPEAVDVYIFLSNEFARGSAVENRVFQFVYRSFYRIDSAGLTPNFKSKYFMLLEESRDLRDVDLRKLTKELHSIRNRKNQESLQFSFVTKLAHTVNSTYPVYDGEVATVFGFRVPRTEKDFDVRLDEYMTFYETLRDNYEEIIRRNLLLEPRRLFHQHFATHNDRIPETKVLDFIFWSAGKQSFTAKQE